jgi:hypothetical protein
MRLSMVAASGGNFTPLRLRELSQMSRQSLRAYILEHRDDDESIESLIAMGNPDSPVYPFP